MITANKTDTLSNQRKRWNHWTIETAVEIDASAEKVWEVLTDFETMANWSSTFQNFKGDFRDGGVVTLNTKFGGSVTDVDHKIFVVQKNGELLFGWNDTKLLGACDDHIYKVVDIGEGKSRFLQTDKLARRRNGFCLGASYVSLYYEEPLHDFQQGAESGSGKETATVTSSLCLKSQAHHTNAIAHRVYSLQ